MQSDPGFLAFVLFWTKYIQMPKVIVAVAFCYLKPGIWNYFLKSWTEPCRPVHKVTCKSNLEIRLNWFLTLWVISIKVLQTRWSWNFLIRKHISYRRRRRRRSSQKVYSAVHMNHHVLNISAIRDLSTSNIQKLHMICNICMYLSPSN